MEILVDAKLLAGKFRLVLTDDEQVEVQYRKRIDGETRWVIPADPLWQLVVRRAYELGYLHATQHQVQLQDRLERLVTGVVLRKVGLQTGDDVHEELEAEALEREESDVAGVPADVAGVPAEVAPAENGTSADDEAPVAEELRPGSEGSAPDTSKEAAVVEEGGAAPSAPTSSAAGRRRRSQSA